MYFYYVLDMNHVIMKHISTKLYCFAREDPVPCFSTFGEGEVFVLLHPMFAFHVSPPVELNEGLLRA